VTQQALTMTLAGISTSHSGECRTRDKLKHVLEPAFKITHVLSGNINQCRSELQDFIVFFSIFYFFKARKLKLTVWKRNLISSIIMWKMLCSVWLLIFVVGFVNVMKCVETKRSRLHTRLYLRELRVSVNSNSAVA
jgi:hypothetical protein